MATIRLTNDLTNLIRQEVAALDWRYWRKRFLSRDPKHLLCPLYEELYLAKPPPAK